MEHSRGFLKLVADAKRIVRETTVAEIRRRQAAGETFHFIDVREDCEWEKGRLPRSVHMGRGVLERDIEKTIPDRGAEIVLYCGGGFRSALAAQSLQLMGYNNVVSMDGGFGGWVEAGGPVEK